MAKLILRREDGTGGEVSLDETGSVTIGRSPECDLPIDDTQASRRHCSVVRLQSGYEVADLGSTNGTLVNSVLIKRKKLRHGDVIRIGHHEIVFDDPAGAEEPGGEGVPESCCLVFARGDLKGSRIELTEQRTTIGRKPTNTVVLHDTVASSYHCEVVRDLNGYTIRDLGSTNGTLVNNEMITEAPLTHGARIRIGNTRFVFQDPAMAEIDLELAGVEDDESEWGMMRELDLAAVKRRNPATLVYAALFVAILGALGYLLSLEGRKKSTGPVGPEGNLIEGYSFENLPAVLAWESDPPGAVDVGRSTRIKGEGRTSMRLKCLADEAGVTYGTALSGTGVRYALKGKLAATGGAKARLGLLWTGLGLRTWTEAPPVGGSVLQPVALTASGPPWATRAVVGIRIAGRGTVFADDISLLRAGKALIESVAENDFRISVADGKTLDVSHAGSPVLFRGRPVAFDGSGNEIDAGSLVVQVEKADDDNVRITITGVRDAAGAGVEFDEVHHYLSQGGFRAFGYVAPDSEESYFVSAFPEQGGRTLSQVRKLLLGPSGRAFAVLASGPEGRLESRVRVLAGHHLWAVYGPPEKGACSFLFKTNLRGEAAEASDAMAVALEQYQAGHWGRFLTQAKRALAEFPFASATMRKRLRDRIIEVNTGYGHLERRATRLLQDYDEFKDLQSLADLRAVLAELSTRYEIVFGKGTRGQRLQKIAAEEETRRKAALRKQQGMLAGSYMDQALYIALPRKEFYSAAVLLAYVAWYLPDSEQAAQAREELAKIDKEHPGVLAVLRELGLKEEG